MQQYREACKRCRTHASTKTGCSTAHFRQICIETETDKERSVRIANEVRAEKWATDAEDMMRRHGGRCRYDLRPPDRRSSATASRPRAKASMPGVMSPDIPVRGFWYGAVP